MGFNLSAFGAGFASAAVKDMEEERKLAELRGADSVKNMLANYKTVTAENKKREAELVANIDLLKTYDPTATESELYALSTKPSVMAAVNDLIKKDAFDPTSFKVSNFAKVAENNTNATALERVKLLSVMPVMAKTTIAEETPSSGNILRDMLGKSAARSQEKALREYAQASGIPLERLQAAQGFVSPKVDVAAEIDMSKLRPEKTFSSEKDALKTAAFKAMNANDPVAAKVAQDKMALINDIENNFTNEQVKFAERNAKLKTASLSGTPEEKKAADAELAKIWEFERKKAEATKVRGDGESKVPAMGTLNTITSSTVSRAIKAVHGALVANKDIAMTENAQGGITVSYLGTDLATRKAVQETQARAARFALSLYLDSKGQPINRDVATILNSFTMPDFQEPQPAAPPPVVTPSLPKPAITGSASSGRNAAPAVPISQTRTLADDAIERGVNREVVAKRFKETTGQDY